MKVYAGTDLLTGREIRLRKTCKTEYEGGGRVGELARIYGIHRTTVSARMSRAGKTRGQPTAAQLGECGAAG